MVDQSRPKSDSHVKAPPNYAKRAMQVRLMALVTCFMLVVVLMQEAAKPKYWSWLFGVGIEAAVDPLTEDEKQRDDPNDQTGSLADTVSTYHATASQTTFAPLVRVTPVASEGEGVRRGGRDIWERVLGHLDHSQRLLLQKAMKAARDGDSLSSEDVESWQATLAELDRLWLDDLTSTASSVDRDNRLTDDDRIRWQAILTALKESWLARQKRALTQLATQSPDGASQEILQDLQAVFDELALEAIDDDSPHRYAEQPAYYRLLGILQGTSLAELEEQEAPRVGYRQLFRQSDHYRGELVRVRGTAIRVYHVNFKENEYGIEGIYKFWVVPLGDQNSLITVHALELPEGFPEVKDRDVDEGTTDMKELVEFTGYFFKRLTYPAQKGTQTAPLMLAKSPTWSPPDESEEVKPPTLSTMVFVLLGILLAGGAIVALVYWGSNMSSTTKGYSPQGRTDKRRMDALNDEELIPTVEDALRQLETETDADDD